MKTDISESKTKRWIVFIWLNDSNVFTSVRILLWSNIINKINHEHIISSILMIDQCKNESFLNMVERLSLKINSKFMDKCSTEYIETMKNLLYHSVYNKQKNEENNDLLIDFYSACEDFKLENYIVTSMSSQQKVHLTDDLYSQLHTFAIQFSNIVSNDLSNEFDIIHICDSQKKYQCEMFSILTQILYPSYSSIKQYFIPITPVTINKDPISTIYDVKRIYEYLTVFKLQLISRRQQSILYLQTSINNNRDTIFLLYFGARISSILTKFETKKNEGYYPEREIYGNQLTSFLNSKIEQDILIWTNSFDTFVLNQCQLHSTCSTQLHLNVNTIFHETMRFCRRLSPYYSKIRVLTENQSHLLTTMFARLELYQRILNNIRFTLSLLDIPLIERM
ncbi:unnamed protein product [Didymodactylos carnosus]|uniref:DALR anticodon binding domain-containing protein n=1 Tax=Didymodactylos carnosus TaxID=1234261 RepID=A0A8S2NEA8_9BILA|nr:unnamed protein product [Didymodactylos carnosus]CAF3990453.1 unnamed protein product [Didymodactylos carnosus]